MEDAILTKARIVSKEWQIKQCEKTIKYATETISERLTEIGLLGDDQSEKSEQAHHSLYSLLKEIDSQEVLRFGLNQELVKLNNPKGYCQCDKCVVNRAVANPEK